MDDAVGDVEYVFSTELSEYVDRIDVVNVKIYIEGENLVFKVRFKGDPLTPEEVVSLMVNNQYRYSFSLQTVLLVGGELSQVGIGLGYTTVSKGETEYMYIFAQVSIDKPFLWMEENITISGNEMVIDIPLITFLPYDVELPNQEDQRLYFEVNIESMTVLAGIIDEVEYIGGSEDSLPDVEQPQPDEQRPSTEVEETTGEAVGIPITLILIGTIIVIGVAATIYVIFVRGIP